MNAGSPEASYQICLEREREYMRFYWTSFNAESLKRKLLDRSFSERTQVSKGPDGTTVIEWAVWCSNPNLISEMKAIEHESDMASQELERRFWAV